MKRRITALFLGISFLLALAANGLTAYAETTDPVCTCEAQDGSHTETCDLYVAPAAPQCTCEAVDGVHTETCDLYEAPAAPQCTCAAGDGVHAETCPLYVAPATPQCTCEAVDGIHTELCPLAPPPPSDSADASPVSGIPYCTCPATDGVHESWCLRAYAIAVKPGDEDLELTVELSQEKKLIFDEILPISVVCDPVNSEFRYQDGVAELKFPATALAGTTYRIIATYEDGRIFNAKFTAAEAPDPEPEFETTEKGGEILGLESASLFVHGSFPVGSTLTLAAADPADIANEMRQNGNETGADFIAGFADTAQPYVAFDISLLDETGAVTQPDGSVTLRLKADKLPTEDNEFLVYHIHGDQVSDPIPAEVDEEGFITFTLLNFSYVIVTGTEANIENVAAYYDIETGGSGNGQYFVLGLYYDTNGRAHLLLRGVKNSSPLDKVEKITVKLTPDGSDSGIATYPVAPDNPDKYTSVRKLTLTEDGTEKKVLYQDPDPNPNSKGTWIADFELDSNVKIEKIFYLSVSTKEDTESNNGFNISNMPVHVKIGYGVQKTIDHLIPVEGGVPQFIRGDSAQGERGKTVVYKIVAHNKAESTDPIKNAVIKDTLPAGLFDTNQVFVSTPLDQNGNYTWGNAPVLVDTNNSFTVATILNFAPGETKTYLVKATILSGAEAPAEAVYVNTASLSGKNAPIEEKDTAVIVIGAPEGYGGLTISKTVVGTDDPAYVAGSIFTFDILALAQGTYTTELYDPATPNNPTPGTITIDGNSFTTNRVTFQLKDGQKLVIQDLPVGSTAWIQEELQNEFNCTAREQQCVIQPTGTTKNLLQFVNSFDPTYVPPDPTDPPDETETDDLTITKTGAQSIDENQSFVFEVTGPDNYKQTVIIHGNDSAVIKDLDPGTYTVTEKKDWSWRYTPTNQDSVTLNFPTEKLAAFTNTRKATNPWLNGSSYADNHWPIPAEPTQ